MIVPNGIARPDLTRVRVVDQGVPARDFLLAVGSAAQEIFKHADGSAAALNQDGSPNSPSNAAKLGSIVAVYVTQGTGPCIDGSINPINPMGTSGFTLGGLEVLYSGPAPALVCGVDQINFRLPQSVLLQSNKYYLPLFDTNLVPSEPVYIYVTR